MEEATNLSEVVCLEQHTHLFNWHFAATFNKGIVCCWVMGFSDIMHHLLTRLNFLLFCVFFHWPASNWQWEESNHIELIFSFPADFWFPPINIYIITQKWIIYFESHMLTVISFVTWSTKSLYVCYFEWIIVVFHMPIWKILLELLYIVNCEETFCRSWR